VLKYKSSGIKSLVILEDWTTLVYSEYTVYRYILLKAIVKFFEGIEALWEDWIPKAFLEQSPDFLVAGVLIGTWPHYCATYNKVKHLLIEILLKTLQQWAG
jgi:hypothetical protein